MTDKINILAICGSTRKSSSNLNLIKALANLTLNDFSVKIFDGLSDLPHFNPDLDNENVVAEVVNFRQLLRDADAVLICTPEYAMGVPGSLKNALDWTVSSMEFSKKPVALITASLSGEKAHASLLETLLVIEARITNDTQLLIPFIQSKIDRDGKITDNETVIDINRLSQSLIQLIKGDLANLLTAPILMNKDHNSIKFLSQLTL